MTHVAGLVAVNFAIGEGGRGVVDVHATSLRARGTLPGHFFHGGHGMGRNGRQRTFCSGESVDEASRRTGTGSVPGHCFHGGHGIERNGRLRTPCSGERGDEASDARARGQFWDTSSMGAMEWGAGGLERRLAPHTAARACAQARGGQFCGVMEWGVTGSSAPTAATSQKTRGIAARARVSSGTLLPWGPWNWAGQ